MEEFLFSSKICSYVLERNLHEFPFILDLSLRVVLHLNGGQPTEAPADHLEPLDHWAQDSSGFFDTVTSYSYQLFFREGTAMATKDGWDTLCFTPRNSEPMFTNPSRGISDGRG